MIVALPGYLHLYSFEDILVYWFTYHCYYDAGNYWSSHPGGVICLGKNEDCSQSENIK